ncbi:MAG TPA: PEP-CTERM sorting domain-containing protein [Lacipirellulaceae bacterium]|jgi:hypothetical protein|nr:PEP-CTERM sorting domain-containing protein [Lacipirellulaceae bacterium]
MTGVSASRKSLGQHLLICTSIVLGTLVCHASALAVVKIFDGFGDADVNNNGIPLEPADVDVSGAGGGTVGPYIALNNGGTPPVFPNNTMVNEVTSVQDASDVGIKWFSIGGFTSGATPTPKVSVHIIDDSSAALPETNPAIGYLSDSPGGPNATRFSTAIGNGLALAAEAKGRANQAAGFFGQQIQLGAAVGDSVKTSFDFRVWMSAPNLNVDTNINHIPAIGELRFGLFQDTDHQLGQTNSVAGPGSTPAVWGQANGNFRGDNGTVGAQGDHGWFVRVPIDDPENASFDKAPNGAEARIVEETNDQGDANNNRIFNGTTDSVAQPDSANPQFVNLDPKRVYNLSLTLTRYHDPATAGTDGNTIFATTTVVDRATGQQWSFGKAEPVLNPTTMAPDGISSDSWDYFAMGLAGSTDSDDFDWLIDNFKVEVTGSNAGGVPGDYNGNGVVDAADYVLWRNGGPLQNEGASTGTVDAADYDFWRAHFGNTSGSGSSLTGGSVPEPGSLVLLLVGGIAAAGTARRKSKKPGTATAFWTESGKQQIH